MGISSIICELSGDPNWNVDFYRSLQDFDEDLDHSPVEVIKNLYLSPQDIIVDEIFVRLGDSIKEGQELFTYFPATGVPDKFVFTADQEGLIVTIPRQNHLFRSGYNIMRLA